ncbi:hypothetical protein MPSEU_000415100 [Mayamaea pseudoterrestris]|nr:hypothetical protein MPSEU_000415100 [Mayamaea pseudoterrestris]
MSYIQSDESKWPATRLSSSNSLKMTTIVKQQDPSVARSPRRRSPPSHRNGSTPRHTRKSSPSRRKETNEHKDESNASTLTYHQRFSSKFDNSASEQEMRSILSEAFCQDNELKLGMIQSEIDRIELAILNGSRLENLHTSIRSIQSAPAFANQGSSSEFQYRLEDGVTQEEPNEVECADELKKFSELDWKKATVEPIATTENIFTSQSLETIANETNACHPRRHTTKISPHRQRNMQVQSIRKRAKSLSHLPVITERRKHVQVVSSNATAASSPATLETQEQRVKHTKQTLDKLPLSSDQPGKAKPGILRKSKQATTSSVLKHDGSQRHHHRHPASSSPRPSSSSPGSKKERLVSAGDLKSNLAIRLESQPEQGRSSSMNRSRDSSNDSSNKRRSLSPHRTSSNGAARKFSVKQTSGKTIAAASKARKPVEQPTTSKPDNSPVQAPPSANQHDGPLRHRRASTGAALVDMSDEHAFETQSTATSGIERRHSVGGFPSQEFQLDTIQLPKYALGKAFTQLQTLPAEAKSVKQSLYSTPASGASQTTMNTASTKGSKTVAKLSSMFQVSPGSERRLFRRRASASAGNDASMAECAQMTNEAPITEKPRRQSRRMSDGGGLSRAYDGMKHTMGPIVSPRKNARRASKIFKGVGHGIGMALQSPLRGEGNVSFDKSRPNSETMRDLAHMIGITDEQIQELHNHGLTIADTALTQGIK